jgi:HSP20 family protein
MAETHRKDTERQSTTKEQSIQTRRGPSRSDLAWRDPFGGFGAFDPFGMMRQFSDQMGRWFGEPSSWGRELTSQRGSRQGSLMMWPQIETFQRGDQLVVRADLPGLKKENVNVEVTDDAITIEGERRAEHEEDREGYYRSERSYGSFYRVIPLPEGAISESAKATFKDGVLEIAVQAPPREASRGRRIEIGESKTSHQTHERSESEK